MTDIAASKIPVAIEDEMKRSYMDYAMSVIIGRALPDVRDGLKPAHRRVLYAMRQMGLASNRPYRKCAKIVGEVIGNYHPHGDAPAYDTLVRLAQDFNMRYPLVDGQGNFGSLDGDPPAAYRYTEARLTPLAEEMMADLDKETVDFVPNFDETTEEPTVLPTPFPNLLANGSAGIAVGMATNVPPHNLREIIDGTIAVVERRGAPREERMRALLAAVRIEPDESAPTRRFAHQPGVVEDGAAVLRRSHHRFDVDERRARVEGDLQLAGERPRGQARDRHRGAPPLAHHPRRARRQGGEIGPVGSPARMVEEDVPVGEGGGPAGRFLARPNGHERHRLQPRQQGARRPAFGSESERRDQRAPRAEVEAQFAR